MQYCPPPRPRPRNEHLQPSPHSQATRRRPLGDRPPVDDLTTGFLGTTDAECRFPAERIPQMEHGQNVDNGWVAVLDERSISTQSYPK